MGFGHLRRFDVQAGYGCVLALVSVVPFVGAATLAFRNYNHELGQIVYGEEGLWLASFAGCLLLSMAPSAVGMLLGWSSAGQRRNDKPVRSWVGFFVGGGVFTFNLILAIAFWMLRLQHPA